MPTTWYVAPGGGAAAVDTSEADAGSVVELSVTASACGKLVVFVSAAGVSAVVSFVELCAAVSVDGRLLVFASVVGVSAVTSFVELCGAVSVGGELVVFASAV